MADINALVQGAVGLQAMRFTNAAALTIYSYNILLTMDMEVEYIWSNFSFSLPTLLYIMNRYLSFPFFFILSYTVAGYHGTLSDDFCKLPINFLGYLFACTAWTGILTLRVCALWQQRKHLVRFIQVLWVCLMGVNILTQYLAFQEEGPITAYNPLMGLCATTSTPHLFKFTPIAPLIFELFLTILTIIKAFDFVVHPSSSSLPLLYRVLARDGVTYYLITTTINAINLVAQFSLPDTILYLFCALYWAMTSTLIAKMMLNLKDAHHQSFLQQLGTDEVDGQFSFASPSQSAFMGASYMGASFAVSERDLKVEWGSESSRSPTCAGNDSGSQYRLEKSV